MKDMYRFTFAPSVPTNDVRDTLYLATLATEAFCGQTEVRLDASYLFDSGTRVCDIDASTRVGRSIAKLFGLFISREFGSDAFEVQRTVGTIGDDTLDAVDSEPSSPHAGGRP